MYKIMTGFKQRGFTLIELLIVIVIIAALAVSVFIALNPQKRLQDARNARRMTDIESIRNAINQYNVDNGALPAGLTAGMQETQIGKSNGTGIGANNVSCVNITNSCNAVSQSCVDLSTPLASYLKIIPQDPLIGSVSATGYSVSVDSNNSVTIKACGMEGSASNQAVVFDNQSSISVSAFGTSFSWNHTTGTGQNRLLVVGISDQGATSVTYNGIALTKLQSQAFNNENAELWYLVNPPSGTYQIAVTTGASGPLAGGASSWSNVNQTMPFGTPLTQTGNAQSVSLNVPSTAGEVVVDNYANSNGADPITVTGGQTSIWNFNQGGCCFDAAGTYIAGSSSTTLSYSNQIAAAYGWVAAAIRSTDEAAPTPTPTSTPTPTPSGGGYIAMTAPSYSGSMWSSTNLTTDDSFQNLNNWNYGVGGSQSCSPLPTSCNYYPWWASGTTPYFGGGMAPAHISNYDVPGNVSQTSTGPNSSLFNTYSPQTFGSGSWGATFTGHYNATPVTYDVNGTNTSFNWTSGSLNTFNKVYFPAGTFTNFYVQVKAQMMGYNGNNGAWNGIWLLGQGNGSRELDLQETGICGSSPNLFCSNIQNPSATIVNYNAGQDLSAGYHIYGIEYNAITGVVNFYLDNQLRGSVTQATNAGPYYLLLDGEIGNGYAGVTAPSTNVDMYMNIMQVQVYQR